MEQGGIKIATAWIDVQIDKDGLKNNIRSAVRDMHRQMSSQGGGMGTQLKMAPEFDQAKFNAESRKLLRHVGMFAKELRHVMDIPFVMGVGAGKTAIDESLKRNTAQAQVFKYELAKVKSAWGDVGEKLLNSNIGGHKMYEWAEKLAQYLKDLPQEKIERIANSLLNVAKAMAAMQAIKISADLIRSVSFLVKGFREIGEMVGRMGGSGINFSVGGNVAGNAAGGALSSVLSNAAGSAAGCYTAISGVGNTPLQLQGMTGIPRGTSSSPQGIPWAGRVPNFGTSWMNEINDVRRYSQGSQMLAASRAAASRGSVAGDAVEMMGSLSALKLAGKAPPLASAIALAVVAAFDMAQAKIRGDDSMITKLASPIADSVDKWMQEMSAGFKKNVLLQMSEEDMPHSPWRDEAIAKEAKKASKEQNKKAIVSSYGAGMGIDPETMYNLEHEGWFSEKASFQRAYGHDHSQNREWQAESAKKQVGGLIEQMENAPDRDENNEQYKSTLENLRRKFGEASQEVDRLQKERIEAYHRQLEQDEHFKETLKSEMVATREKQAHWSYSRQEKELSDKQQREDSSYRASLEFADYGKQKGRRKEDYDTSVLRKNEDFRMEARRPQKTGFADLGEVFQRSMYESNKHKVELDRMGKDFKKEGGRSEQDFLDNQMRQIEEEAKLIVRQEKLLDRQEKFQQALDRIATQVAQQVGS